MDVLVLMGGTSAEREVSLNSGKAVGEGLKQAGDSVSTYDFNPDENRDIFDLVNSTALRKADVVFIALHGGEGEDGRIQALLELVGKPYTGSGVRASALCMDKAVSKIVLERYGIETPAWAYLRNERVDPAHARKAITDLGGLPIVVKPVDQGSTIGVSIVEKNHDLEPAIDLAQRYSPGLVLEKYIAGKELSVSVIEDKVFPIVEIKPKEGFYDYGRKYTKGMTDYECPAPISKGLSERIQEKAIKAYSVLGCEGFGRVDLRLGHDGIPYFLEVNTIPGMTETSLVPMAARTNGMAFPELVHRITMYAWNKSKMRNPRTGG